MYEALSYMRRVQRKASYGVAVIFHNSIDEHKRLLGYGGWGAGEGGGGAND